MTYYQYAGSSDEGIPRAQPSPRQACAHDAGSQSAPPRIININIDALHIARHEEKFAPAYSLDMQRRTPIVLVINLSGDDLHGPLTRDFISSRDPSHA